MIDLELSLLLLALAAIAAVAYAAHVVRRGPARNARVERAGSSLLLGKREMEGAYYFLEPVGRAAASLGLSANAVTVLSLLISLAGAVAIAAGHFGVGGALTVIAALGDALDGVVARQTRTTSAAGEVLDASVDRYEEFFLLGALAYYFHETPVFMGLALLALLGSYMVSYGTAKAEALGVEAPRGSMRRAERAVCLTSGVVLTPIAEAIGARLGLPAWAGTAPVVASLALVGVAANVSAVRRLTAIARSLRARSAATGAPPEPRVADEVVRSAP